MSQSHDDKRSALAATVAFSGCTMRQLDEIAKVSTVRDLEPGEPVCHQHQFGLDTFVIADGQASVWIDGVKVGTYGRGEVVGDWALFGDGRRSATVQADSALRLVVVDPREMDSLMAAAPVVASSLGPPSRRPIHWPLFNAEGDPS